MDDPLVLASLVFGGAGLLLGLIEFRRRERLLSRLRPWQRHADSLAEMGREYARNADNLRGRLDEAERVLEEMTTAAAELADALRRAGVEFRGDRPDPP